MKYSLTNLFVWLFLKIFPALPYQVEGAKKTIRRQAGMAVEISIAFVYVSVFLAVLFAISILCYTAFYLWIMPEIRHEIPLHLQFDDCGDSAFASSATPPTVPADTRCFYPNAVVNFTALDAALFLPEHYVRNRAGTDVHILMPGQKYSFFLNVLLPESEHNRSLGMFMVSMVAQTNHGADGNSSIPTELLRTTRHALLRYKSVMRRIVENALLAPLFVFDWRDEAQRIKVPLVEAYYESYLSPTSCLTVQINKRRIELYEASIVIEAQLEGVKYWMYNHRIVVGIVIVGCNFLLLSLITVVSFIGRAVKLSGRTTDKLGGATTSAYTYTSVNPERRRKHVPEQSSGFGRDDMPHEGFFSSTVAAADKPSRDNNDNVDYDFAEEFESYDAVDDVASPSHQRATNSSKTRRMEDRQQQHAVFLKSLQYSNAATSGGNVDAGLNRAQVASRTMTTAATGVSQAAHRSSSSSGRRNLSVVENSSTSGSMFAHAGTEAEKRASVRAFLDELRKERVAVHHRATANRSSHSPSSYSAGVQPLSATETALLYNRSISDVIRNAAGIASADRHGRRRLTGDADSLCSMLGASSIDDYAGGGVGTSQQKMRHGKSLEGFRYAPFLPEIIENITNNRRSGGGGSVLSATIATRHPQQRSTGQQVVQRQYSSGSSTSNASSATGSTVEYANHTVAAEDDIDSGVGSRATTVNSSSSGLQRLLLEQQRAAARANGGKLRRRRSNTSNSSLLR